ncbi:unnamed protein product [Effrenium voratum]|uniref:Uncharacterized protein n=1 Tax=Effrenium voratum TaxID=2562239 RepID=A0AA36I4Y6_9DINO|nr:unnamed protein product [Effrenium voratum]CAJ1413760.1 unnamed protein product [Effrenium voratum]
MPFTPALEWHEPRCTKASRLESLFLPLTIYLRLRSCRGFCWGSSTLLQFEACEERLQATAKAAMPNVGSGQALLCSLCQIFLKLWRTMRTHRSEVRDLQRELVGRAHATCVHRVLGVQCVRRFRPLGQRAGLPGIGCLAKPGAVKVRQLPNVVRRADIVRLRFLNHATESVQRRSCHPRQL